jgi:cell division protein ZapA
VGWVTLRIHGRPYEVGCEDGGEAHLISLAADIDERVRQVAAGAGAPGEARLILMAALTLADDLRAAQTELSAREDREAGLRAEMARLVERATAALDAVSARLEAMVPE